jgi:hypothetical protein
MFLTLCKQTGGLGNNNPVLMAMREAEQLWGFHCLVCVTSVGTMVLCLFV